MFQSLSPFGQVQGQGIGIGSMFQSQSQSLLPMLLRPFPRQRQSQSFPVPIPVPSPSATFVFTQSVLASTWTIDYPFIGQFPSVTVTDSAGNVVIADVQYIVGLNRVLVRFATPFAGVAYLNV